MFATWNGFRRCMQTAARFLGQKDLEGRTVNLFQSDKPFEQITVWVDPHTNLPIRVERVQMPSPNKDIRVPYLKLSTRDFPKAIQSLGSASCGVSVRGPGVLEGKVTTILTDFVWNPPLDESLFQTAIPEEYDKALEIDAGDWTPDEVALVAALRFWAETSQGAFPADINDLLDVKPKLVERFQSGRTTHQALAEAYKAANMIMNGLFFAQTLKSLDNWHYNVNGVMLGEASKVVCWWRKDGGGYRVICGDLSIRDTPREPLADAT